MDGQIVRIQIVQWTLHVYHNLYKDDHNLFKRISFKMTNKRTFNGELMGKKGFCIGILAFLLVIISCSLVIAQQKECCVYEDGCSETLDGTCNSGQTPRTDSCNLIPDCNIGCCCSDNTVLGDAIKTKKACINIQGDFEELSTYISNPIEYQDACESLCGLGGTCTAEEILYCSDQTTILATCVSGAWEPEIGVTCPSIDLQAVDSDGDGTPDTEDQCPNEFALTNPDSETETYCLDNIDEDCDGRKDCEDDDCCADPACEGSPVCMATTCGDGSVDAGEECDDGNANSLGHWSSVSGVPSPSESTAW